MKVIIWENVKRIGSIVEVIDVKRGFARNFLIANKKALYASKENIKEVEKIKSDLAKKDNDKKKEAQKIHEKINNKEYNVMKLSTENNELYGSVKPTEISKIILENLKIDINPSLIQLVNEIKALGTFKIKINFNHFLLFRHVLMSYVHIFNCLEHGPICTNWIKVILQTQGRSWLDYQLRGPMELNLAK